MKVIEAYEKYTIPVNLQKHMLRVAALSQIIIESWHGPKIDTNSVLFTCLFHDMANIIKFNFSKPSLFKEEDSRVNYWKKIQETYIAKYGADVQQACLTIAKELGLHSPIVKLIQKLEWERIQEVVETGDYESAITIYCDMRVGPYGILSIKERLDNLKTRISFTNYGFYEKMGPQLESFIQKNVSIPLSSINEVHLTDRFETLRKYEILSIL